MGSRPLLQPASAAVPVTVQGCRDDGGYWNELCQHLAMSTSTITASRSSPSPRTRAAEAPSAQALRPVLVTGSSGEVGSSFAKQAAKHYALRLMVRPGDPKAVDLHAYGTIVACDLTDLEQLKKACAGIDTVVHLAAEPDPSAVWSELLESNIVGAYNLFVAAKAAGCRRVVFASSIHAVSGYPAEVQVKTSEAVNPGDLYGVTKCFGEALGRYMAEQEDLSVICIRIGAYTSFSEARTPALLPMLDAYISPRDLYHLIERSIETENLRFAIVHGISDNCFKRLDISDARTLLGYAPRDDFSRVNPALQDLRVCEERADHNLHDEGQESGLREDL